MQEYIIKTSIKDAGVNISKKRVYIQNNLDSSYSQNNEPNMSKINEKRIKIEESSNID